MNVIKAKKWIVVDTYTNDIFDFDDFYAAKDYYDDVVNDNANEGVDNSVYLTEIIEETTFKKVYADNFSVFGYSDFTFERNRDTIDLVLRKE